MNKSSIIELLQSWNYSDFKTFYDKYVDFFKTGYQGDFSERVEQSIIYPHALDALVVFEIRCNDDISFNNVTRNNDLLFVVELVDINDSIVLHQFDATTDPCSKQSRIAHTARQIYRGNVDCHHGIIGRECIRSDQGGGTWLKRTNTQGEVIPLNNGHADAELGHYGINIHDNGGFFNSSLGCTILSGGSYLQAGPYRDEYRPLLLKCGNKQNIPVSLLDIDDFEDVFNHTIGG